MLYSCVLLNRGVDRLAAEHYLYAGDLILTILIDLFNVFIILRYLANAFMKFANKTGESSMLMNIE